MGSSALSAYQARHGYLVCIDSDGCVFDTMETKHKECFCPATINAWDLQAVSRYAREAWEYVNLYSQSRGCTRFKAVVEVLDLLAEREEVRQRKFRMPDYASLRRWVETAPILNNDAVSKLTGDPVMARTLAWSHEMNRRTSELVRNIPPFPHVRESLAALSKQADIVVVSATPREALEREWKENDIDRYCAMIGAQEDGSKKDIIRSIQSQYAPGRAIMLGDAPGDCKAAQSCGILFYPIRPGSEAESWQEFYEGVLDRFFEGAYTREEMDRQLVRFNQCLPSSPPWKR